MKIYLRNVSLLLGTYFFLALPAAFSKDIIQITEKVGKHGQRFALAIAFVGALIAGGSYVLGRPDAEERTKKVIIGTLIITCASAIISTLQSWV